MICLPPYPISANSAQVVVASINFFINKTGSCTFVTVSGKTGLIVYLKVLRNIGFKYSECYSWPMVVAMHTKFSDVLQQFLTFLIIQ